MSGALEQDYALVITGICIPPFVHYAIKWIRAGLPVARKDLMNIKAATQADFARTRAILWRKIR